MKREYKARQRQSLTLLMDEWMNAAICAYNNRDNITLDAVTLYA